MRAFAQSDDFLIEVQFRAPITAVGGNREALLFRRRSHVGGGRQPWMIGTGLRLHGIQYPSEQCADTVRGWQRARVNELLNDHGIACARSMGGHRLPADAVFAHEPYFLAT